MKKKCLSLFVVLIFLNGCKEDKKPPVVTPTAIPSTSSITETNKIEDLVNKSWHYLGESIYQNRPIYQWVFDGEVIKTGDDAIAKLALPTRKLAIGSSLPAQNLPHGIDVAMPATTINVMALKDNVAEFTSKHDLAQYKLLLPQNLATLFSIDLSGHLSLKYDVDLITSRLNNMSDQFEQVELNLQLKRAEDEASKLKVSMSGGQSAYKITYHDNSSNDNSSNDNSSNNDANPTIDVIGQGQLENYSSQQIEQKNNITFTEQSDFQKVNWTVHWSQLSTKLLDYKKLNECTSLLLTQASQQDQKNTDESADCYLSLIQQGLLGDLAVHAKIPEMNVTYNLMKQQDTTETSSANAPQIKADTVSVIMKDNVMNATLVEKEGFIDITTSVALNNIEASYDLTSYHVPDGYRSVIKSYLPLSIHYKTYLQGLKRDSIQALTGITDIQNFDISGLTVGFDINYTTIDGFISAHVVYQVPEQGTFASQVAEQESMRQHVKITIQIKNLDSLVTPIQSIEPKAGLFAAILKGLGVVDETDKSLTNYLITFDDKGSPLVNGKPVPY